MFRSEQKNHSYELNTSPSSIVSGNIFPLVSGRYKTRMPPITAENPNIRRGRGSHTSSRSKMRGARIPPTLAAVEHIPTPTLLQRNERKIVKSERIHDETHLQCVILKDEFQTDLNLEMLVFDSIAFFSSDFQAIHLIYVKFLNMLKKYVKFSGLLFKR